MPITNILSNIQLRLNAPKGQKNTFGNYNYRSCEDILSAVKPLLAEHNATITLTDEMVMVGDRVYVKATATITGDGSFSCDGWAREAQTKKGMDDAQITGAASSYARKYALNGLLAIDDTKDADATNNHGKTNLAKNYTPEAAPPVNPLKIRFDAAKIVALRNMDEAQWDQEIALIKKEEPDVKRSIALIEHFAGVK